LIVVFLTSYWLILGRQMKIERQAKLLPARKVESLKR